MTMRKRRSKPLWKIINREWLPEIIIAIALILAAFYFLLNYTLHISLLGDFKEFASAFNRLAQWFFNINNLIRIIAGIGLIYFFIVRIRHHTLRLASNQEICPVCNHQIVKKPRQFYQRLLSIFVPLRSYHCSNCSWEGVRVYRKKRKSRKSKRK